MFDRAVDLGSLTSISASPPNGFELSSVYNHRTSYDSMDNEQRSSVDDSLFEKTGQPSSVSSDSVFGDNMSHSYAIGLLSPHHFRPLSALSLNSSHGPSVHDDDTMISVCVDNFAHKFALTIRCRCWEEATSVAALFFL